MIDENINFEMTIPSTLKYYFFLTCFRVFNTKQKIKELNKLIIENLNKLYHSLDEIIKKNDIINDFIKNELLIENIFEAINFDKYIENYVESFYNKYEKDIINNKPKTINILVIGESGVGKSTLINSFFNMDLAKTGTGASITQYFTPYTNPNNANDLFKLIDSKGIQSYPNDIIKIIEYIKEKLKSENKDQFIHCIWYCNDRVRYGENNLDGIKRLLNTYEDDYLPVIIVKTISDYPIEDDEFLEKYKDYLKDFNQLEYVKVLAKEKHEKPFGLDELKAKTLRKIGKAEKSSFYQSIKEKIESLYKKKIDYKYNEIMEQIETLLNSLQNVFVKSNFENIFYKVLNIIFFNGNEEYNIKEKLNENKSNISNISKNDNCIRTINNEKYFNIIDIDNDNENNNLINETNEDISLKEMNKYNTSEQNLDNLLNKLNNNYKKLYEDEIMKIYENILGKKFENLKTTNNRKKRIFNSINEEIRKLKPENNQAFALELEEYNKDKIDLTQSIIINNEIIKENDIGEKTNIYKIDYKDIFILMDIKKKFIRESIKFVSNEVLNYIKKKMKSDMYISKLKELIGSKIIKKMEEGQKKK